MTKSKQKEWYKRWWAITLFVIVGLIILGSLLPDSNNNSQSQQTEQKITTPSLSYTADTQKIKSELQNQGYTVQTVDFNKNSNGYYVLQVMIDTKGNYDKEVLDAYKSMYNNAVADYYLVGISDFEIQSAWSFTAKRKTLDDFFSGKISEDEYIKQVDSERLI